MLPVHYSHIILQLVKFYDLVAVLSYIRHGIELSLGSSLFTQVVANPVFLTCMTFTRKMTERRQFVACPSFRLILCFFMIRCRLFTFGKNSLFFAVCPATQGFNLFIVGDVNLDPLNKVSC